jgi:hypothetical protein
LVRQGLTDWVVNMSRQAALESTASARASELNAAAVAVDEDGR